MTSETITVASAGVWKLGDRLVSRLGFGARRLTVSAAFDLGTPSNRTRSISVLRRALDLGVNHIDTAAFYFSSLRSANELINRALPRTRTIWSSPPRLVPGVILRRRADGVRHCPSQRAAPGRPAGD